MFFLFIDMYFEGVLKMLDRATNIDATKAWFFVMDRESQFEIIRLNTEDQLLDEGVDSKDEPLFSKRHNRGVYSYMTEQFTQGRKKAGDHYTLRDTGEFYRSFIVRVDANGFTIVADTQKDTTDLSEEYGIDILGLTEENTQVLVGMLTRKYREYANEVIFQ